MLCTNALKSFGVIDYQATNLDDSSKYGSMKIIFLIYNLYVIINAS